MGEGRGGVFTCIFALFPPEFFGKSVSHTRPSFVFSSCLLSFFRSIFAFPSFFIAHGAVDTPSVLFQDFAVSCTRTGSMARIV